MLPPDFDLDRVQQHVSHLTEEIGPRSWGSENELQAAIYVNKQLRAAGWTPKAMGRPPNHVSCRGQGGRLFIAHIDTVPGSPGAVDNAAAVGILLELARSSQAEDLCLAFTDGEEAGLRGALDMVRLIKEWNPKGEEVELVVATELLGQGDVAIMGLGSLWDQDRLSWLAENLDPVPQVPFPYRVYSRLNPRGERSDHGPFAFYKKIPSMLVFGRAPAGAFVQYHQPGDTQVDRARIAQAAATLEALATAPALPAADTGPLPDASTLVAGHVLPSALSWLLVGGGALSGLLDLRRLRELPAQLLRVIAAVAVCAGLMAPLVAFGLFGSAPAELTALSTTGQAATGWWTAAPFAVAAATLAFFVLRWQAGPRGSAPLASALLMGVAIVVDPLLGALFGAAALLSRLHPLLALLPAAYLLQPDILRELSFHGLVPPIAWGGAWLLAWPALGSRKPPSPAVRAAAATHPATPDGLDA